MPFSEREQRKRLFVREARAADQEIIRKVTLAGFREYESLMPHHWENYQSGILATLADPKPALQLVAEQEGAIVGTVLLYPAGTRFSGPGRLPDALVFPEIRLLAVSPDARGKGIGTDLLRECIRRSREAGALAITLHTGELMRPAIRIYERMGFVRSPELDFYPAEDLTIMGYRLDLRSSSP